MTILDALKIGFLAFAAISLGRQTFTLRNRRLFKVTFGAGFKRLIGPILLNIPVLAVVLTIGSLLIDYGGPVLKFSWLQLLATKGHEETGGNLMVAGTTQVPIFGAIFALLLFANLPRLARYEEESFRYGTKTWGQGLVRSLRFGLTHCLIGVPIGFGLALGVGGLWFTYHYFRGGLAESTRYHAVYNAWLVVALITLLSLSIFGVVKL